MHGEEGESSDGTGSDGDSSEQENDGEHAGGGRACADDRDLCRPTARST